MITSIVPLCCDQNRLFATNYGQHGRLSFFKTEESFGDRTYQRVWCNERISADEPMLRPLYIRPAPRSDGSIGPGQAPAVVYCRTLDWMMKTVISHDMPNTTLWTEAFAMGSLMELGHEMFEPVGLDLTECRNYMGFFFWLDSFGVNPLAWSPLTGMATNCFASSNTAEGVYVNDPQDIVVEIISNELPNMFNDAYPLRVDLQDQWYSIALRLGLPVQDTGDPFWQPAANGLPIPQRVLSMVCTESAAKEAGFYVGFETPKDYEIADFALEGSTVDEWGMYDQRKAALLKLVRFAGEIIYDEFTLTATMHNHTHCDLNVAAYGMHGRHHCDGLLRASLPPELGRLLHVITGPVYPKTVNLRRRADEIVNIECIEGNGFRTAWSCSLPLALLRLAVDL